MKLLRPHIPLEVRCRVAARQLGLRPDLEGDKRMGRLGLLLDAYLQMLATELGCEVSQLHLDHDPALGAREKVFSGLGRHVNYKPEANDPEFLVYRERHAHHIKTNVRGDGAQHPDRVLIKKQRRREKLVDRLPIGKELKRYNKSPTLVTKVKKAWPKRKLRSASRWPKNRKLSSSRRPRA